MSPEPAVGLGDDTLRVIVASLPLGFALLGDDGRLRFASPRLQRLLGYSAAELATKRCVELTHPGDAAAEEAYFEALVAGERSEYQLHKRCLHANGSVVWVRQTVVRHASEVPPLIVAVVEDVTAARGSEDRQRQLLYTLGERLKELTALHRTARLLLQTRATRTEQLESVVALLPPAMQYPDIATACIRYAGETHCSAEHVETPWRLDASFETADGTPGVVEVAYREPRPEEAAGPFLAEEVTLLHSLAEMIRAAIDRQNAEQQLRETHERMSLAFRAAGMGIWEWDVARNTTFWSAELSAVLGLAGDHTGVFGQNRDAIHPDDRSAVFARLERAALGEDDLRGLELRMRSVDGRWLKLGAHAMIVRVPPARATRIVVALIDVTEQRALQETLRQRETAGR